MINKVICREKSGKFCDIEKMRKSSNSGGNCNGCSTVTETRDARHISHIRGI